ncbi:MAG: hypothetical protein NT005_04725 [Spirochaetes bacterium]|nr:hypothetical protein [Spirochaetota bacterium]
MSILSQMRGRVEKVNADCSDRAKKGQVLVALNTDMLELEEKECRAAVRKARANYDLQLLDVQNNTKLAAKELITSGGSPGISKRRGGESPLLCPSCGSQIKISTLITDPAQVRKILRHLLTI